MPTYEYECQKCGHRFDEFQSMTAKPLVRCPKCKGKLKRLIGAGAGFLFKGSGFYVTDYRSKGYKESAKKEKGGGSADKPAASGGSASTPPSGGTGESPPAKPTPPSPAKE